MKIRPKEVAMVCMLFSIGILLAGSVQADPLHESPQGFVHPIVHPKVSSQFGFRKHPVRKSLRHHSGIDLAAPSGSLIRAMYTGTVVYADPHGGYGNFIVIQHPNGLTSHYGHCKTISVSPGTTVKTGEVIGTVGSTGLSTGPHLHLEIRYKGQPLDPKFYAPGLTARAEG